MRKKIKSKFAIVRDFKKGIKAIINLFNNSDFTPYQLADLIDNVVNNNKPKIKL